MEIIQIRHIEGTCPASFQVMRLSDGKSTNPSPVSSPVDFRVEGRPKSDLLKELRWYLEDFLEYPFSPETEHAERVLESLRKWGETAFLSLFGSTSGRDWYKAATLEGLSQLDVQISSDDPKILAWPWEALRDPEIGFLGLGCQIERKLNRVADPLPLSEELPKERVNILLVTARPYEEDVGYRSISRSMVELIENLKLPARVSVLRPPTFDQLREHLREHPNYYHIFHFDGHGGFGAPFGSGGGPYTLHGPQGRLIFEAADGRPEPVEAEKLGELLREYRIPLAVLNACQSGKVDERAEDAFASVAASMVKAGIRSVTAMGYSLYVSGAREFLPAFYRRLFEEGDVAKSMRAGRQQMYAKRDRICARGGYYLEDWLVPVVYQQAPTDFLCVSQPHKTEESIRELPKEARDEDNPYGFIGRDAAILQLERAMRRAPSAIVINGLGGVGKTTLARGFVRWLSRTEGLREGHCFWLTFTDIRSAEYVFNRMGEAVFGSTFISKSIKQKVDALAKRMKEDCYVVVWDNFETVQGIEGSIEASMPVEDQEHLTTFLKELRGGRTKILITSRREENWLGAPYRFNLRLGGLEHEERWEFCEVIIRDLGLKLDRENPEILKLMQALDGHPLMMRVILPKLEEQSAEAITEALKNNIEELGLGAESTEAKLMATLKFVEQSLPKRLQELLIPLSFYERFVVRGQLQEIAKHVDDSWTGARIGDFFRVLVDAGLLRDRGNGVYEIHPGLHGYLHLSLHRLGNADRRNDWAYAFVLVSREAACEALLRVAKSPHEAPGLFHTYDANLRKASVEARRLGMENHFADIIQCLAHLALDMRHFQNATDFYQQHLEYCERNADARGEAAAYHQLGMVARAKGDYLAADEWSQKSLQIKQQLRDERGVAISQYQRAQIAIDCGNLTTAEELFRIAATEFKRLGEQEHEASANHYRGVVAMKLGHLAEAEAFFYEALNVKLSLQDPRGVGQELYYLGEIAVERGDLTAARQKFEDSLASSIARKDEKGKASNWSALARIAERTGRHDEAKQYYLKALAVEEKIGRETEMANLYHEIGNITEKEDDILDAQQWFKKALAIDMRRGNELGFWTTYAQLAKLEFRIGNHIKAADLLVASIRGLERAGDLEGQERNRRNLMSIYGSATEREREIIMKKWEEASLGPFPEKSLPPAS